MTNYQKISKKLVELDLLANEIEKFDEDLFVSNCLSSQEVKENYRNHIAYYNDDLKKESTNLDDLLKEVDIFLQETKKDLELLKKGQKVTALAFI